MYDANVVVDVVVEVVVKTLGSSGCTGDLSTGTSNRVLGSIKTKRKKGMFQRLLCAVAVVVVVFVCVSSLSASRSRG